MKKTLFVMFIAGALFSSAQKKGQSEDKSYWPNGARLVVSFSLQFETGGQTPGASSPMEAAPPLPAGFVDFPAESWFRYGANEGVYRILNMLDKHNVKVTSHVVGAAAEKYPEIAKAIANRGHELAAHGSVWGNQWNLSYEDELQFVKKGVDVVEKITGQRAVGYNCNWMRRSPNTLKVLQDLGFTYHIDDTSRDEPFVTMVRGKRFAIIPYTFDNNDIVNISGNHWSPDQFLAQLKASFDQLYEEGGSKRRMMSVSLHDRIAGTAAMVHVVEEFIEYAKKHKGVVFMRKVDIAKIVLEDPNALVDNSEERFNK